MADTTGFLDRLIALLAQHRVQYCLIDQQAVNAYVEPLVSLSQPGSDLRVQIQTDPRYASFVERAAIRDVLGIPLPVAALEEEPPEIERGILTLPFTLPVERVGIECRHDLPLLAWAAAADHDRTVAFGTTRIRARSAFVRTTAESASRARTLPRPA